MLLELSKWLFINLMVALGLNALAAHRRLFPRVTNSVRYPWRDVVAYTVMAVFCMVVPWSPEPGVQLDLRNVVIGLVGWMHGLPAATPVAIIVMAVRLVKGGAGVDPAIASIAFTLLLVPFFRRRPRTLPWVLLFGSLQTLELIIAFQVLMDPHLEWARPDSPVWLTVGVVYFIAYLMLGSAHDLVRETLELREVLATELRSKEALLELIPYGILKVDDQQHASGLNHAGRLVLVDGHLPAPVTQHPEIGRALRERQRISGCRIALTKGETEHVVLVSAVPVRNGSVLGVQNVTSLVKEEREVAQRERLELLGHLAAMAAHEIKNPLTTIKGFLQLFQRRQEFADHAAAFALIQGEVEQINQVVRDFLMLSGSDSKQPAVVDVDALVHEVVEVMRLRHTAENLEIEVTGEGGLTLWADRKSLVQILKNLMFNACEAMPAGGRLTLRRDRLGTMVRITVSDTGPGIPTDVLPLIFRPYVTTKETGTGLGLAISHKLATEQGGSLDVVSEVGRGSQFHLLVPAFRGSAMP